MGKLRQYEALTGTVVRTLNAEHVGDLDYLGDGRFIMAKSAQGGDAYFIQLPDDLTVAAAQYFKAWDYPEPVRSIPRGICVMKSWDEMGEDAVSLDHTQVLTWTQVPVGDPSTQNTIFRIQDVLTGSIFHQEDLGSLEFSISFVGGSGITWDGHRLWVTGLHGLSSNFHLRNYTLDGSGPIRKNFIHGLGASQNMVTIAWGGNGQMWSIRNGVVRLDNINGTDRKLAMTWTPAGAGWHGICTDGSYIWVLSDE